MLSLLLFGLSLVSLLMVAITVILAQGLRLAGDDENRILFIQGIILVLGMVSAFPIIIIFAYIVDMLEGLVGTRCPACGQRELEWRSGSWKYGAPPDYLYFACANCGSKFRQLWGGQGVLADLERV
jgi:DNA-directed RNA polymerase subunit RPC12/RpoP